MKGSHVAPLNPMYAHNKSGAKAVMTILCMCMQLGALATVKPLSKDTLKEDKPPNKGQA